MSKPVFMLAAIVLVLAAVESISFTCFSLVRKKINWAKPMQLPLTAPINPNIFNATLGWVSRFPTPYGERPRPHDYKYPFMATFGDSFTGGDEVKDDETWQAFLSQSKSADIFNFGQGGYGTDQALIRYQGIGRIPGVSVVTMGLILENINRIVNVYRPFLYPSTGIALTKPRFCLSSGSLELVPNPVQSENALVQLANVSFLKRIGRNDHWYLAQHLPHFAFPFTRLLFDPSVWRQIRPGSSARAESAGPALLWSEPQARDLMFAILDAFVVDAKSNGHRPIILLSPISSDLRGQLRGVLNIGRDALMGFCQQKGIACFDGISRMAKHLTDDTSVKRLYGKSHMSKDGNRLFASELEGFLKEQRIFQ